MGWWKKATITWNPQINYNNYYEPFIGGGALLFSNRIETGKKYYINDYNEELVNVYNTIKNDVEDLITDLKKHVNTSEYFYDLRKLDRDEHYQKLSNVKRASRFIFFKQNWL